MPISGEPLTVLLASSFFSACSPACPPLLLNLYGSTEVSGDATCFALSAQALPALPPGEPFVPLGQPLANVTIEVSDDGEVVVGGVAVAKGYYGESEAQGGFLPDGRFKTGDVAERRATDGLLMFRGRRDGVVKVRGVRVGVEEAEARMKAALGGESGDMAVAVMEGQEGRVLGLALTAKAMEAGTTEAQVLALLRASLPSSLVPSVVVVLEALPTTASGKTDRRLLAKRMADVVASRRRRARESVEDGGEGESPMESWLEAVYVEVVGGAGGAKGQPLLLRGGDSLAAAQVLWRIRQEWGAEMTVEQLQGSVGEVASLIEGQGRGRKRGREVEEEEKAEGGAEEAMEEGPRVQLSESWRVNLSKCIDATPTVVEGPGGEPAMVVIGSHAHLVVGVEVESGREVWRRTVGGRVEATAARGTVEDLVFVGCHDHRLYAIHGRTGALAWAFETGGEIKCRPLVLSLGDAHDIVAFGSYDGRLYVLDQRDGSLLAQVSIGGSLFASPIALPSPPSILLCTNRGTLSRWLVTPPSPPATSWSLTLTWTHDLKSPTFSTPCLSPSSSLLLLGCTDGSVRAIGASDGQPAWRRDTPQPVFSSPVVATPHDTPGADVVFIGCHDGKLRAIQASDGKLLWCTTIPPGPKDEPSRGAIFSRPLLLPPATVVDGSSSWPVVCVATCSGRLCLLDGRSGRALGGATWAVDGELFSSPIAVGDRLLVGCRDDHLYCLQLSRVTGGGAQRCGGQGAADSDEVIKD